MSISSALSSPLSLSLSSGLIGGGVADDNFNSIVVNGSVRITDISGADDTHTMATVAGRVRTDELASNQYFMGNSGSTSIQFRDDLGLRARAYDVTPTEITDFIAAGALAVNSFMNIVISYDLTSGKISSAIVDGVLVDSDSGTSGNNLELSEMVFFSRISTGQSSEFMGEVDFIWFNAGADIDPATLYAALFNADGSHNYRPTGVAAGFTPNMYQAGTAEDWMTGVGVVGSYTVTGTMTDGASDFTSEFTSEFY